MPTAAFLSALNLVRNATPEQLRQFLNPRDLELALQGIGITGTDLHADELQVDESHADDVPNGAGEAP